MSIRLTVQPEFQVKNITGVRSGNFRRKAWLTMFAVSGLFWAVMALMVWHLVA